MPRLLYRYLLRELLIPFLGGVATFTFVLLIARILKLIEMVVTHGIPPLQMLRLFSYLLPAFLELTVPMALLLAIIIALGRLSADGEVTALASSGVSLYQIAAPVAAFSLVVTALTAFLSIYARPRGNAALKAALFQVAKTRASVGLKPHVFNDDFAGLVIYVEAIDNTSGTLRRVMIADERDPEERNTVFAREGEIIPDQRSQRLTLRLRDGTIHTFDLAGRSYRRTDFTLYDVNLDLAAALDSFRRHEPSPREMTLSELRATIRRKRAAGRPHGPELTELHRKFSIPFACVVFALVGVPLGIQPSRSVKARGLTVSIALLFVYYLLLSAGQALAGRELVPAAIALWTPNFFFGIIGAVLFGRAAAGRPVLPELGHLAPAVQALSAKVWRQHEGER